MPKKYLVQLKQCLLLLGFQKEALQYFENKHKRKCFNENMEDIYNGLAMEDTIYFVP